MGRAECHYATDLKGILATDNGALNALLSLMDGGNVPWLEDVWLARLSTLFVVSWMGTPYYMVLARDI